MNEHAEKPPYENTARDAMQSLLPLGYEPAYIELKFAELMTTGSTTIVHGGVQLPAPAGQETRHA